MMSKETIKQFLKPDWRKIVLTIVIIVLSYIPYTSVQYPGGGEGYYFISGYFWEFVSHHIVSFFVSVIPESLISFLVLMILAWVVHMMCFYLLSSLIIFIYDKFRSKK